MSESRRKRAQMERQAQQSQEHDIFSSVESIMAIRIPKYEMIANLESPDKNIEYILQCKAMEFKRLGQMSLAIACLRKSNEIMPHSNFVWAKKDYLRLIEYLKQNGQFGEARVEEARLRQTLPQLFSVDQEALFVFRKSLSDARCLRTDLIEMSSHYCTCAECAKYQGRVYSINGKDRRFPLIPDHIKKYGVVHEACRHTFYPYLPDLVNRSELMSAIKRSNSPYIDNRTDEEKALYENKKAFSEQMICDRGDYDYIRELLPEIAPKSFAGYRKMKSTNSKNYQKLMAEIERRKTV